MIVDDHPIVREGLAAVLSHKPGLEVCGEAASIVEALAAIDSQHPDLAIIDLSLAVRCMSSTGIRQNKMTGMVTIVSRLESGRKRPRDFASFLCCAATASVKWTFPSRTS